MQLEIQELTKIYAGNRGLQPTSFNVETGELVAVVGHNGAGKSTLLKILASWIVPDAGRVLINGTDLKNRILVAKSVGFIPEVPNLFEFFSVNYNLRLFAALFQAPGKRVEQVVEEFSLGSFRKSKVQVLSKGMRQRVSLARALLADPPLLLFDEPTSGLDFEMTKDFQRLLGSMHEAGKTILFTSHRPEEIKNIATRMIVLHQGKIAFDGSPNDYFLSPIHQNLYA
jgi:ABC-type multidrug transport system ATPase subunit